MSDFLSALVLLLIGAGLTGVLIPIITRQWQLQQKAIEIKSALIEEITEMGTEMFLEVIKPVTARLLAEEEGAESDLTSKFFEWVVRSQVIASRLKLYFRDELSVRWIKLYDLHQKFFLLSAQKAAGARAEALQDLK